MLKRLKTFFWDIRINRDFPRYERNLRDEHERQAQSRFSTKQLKIEKDNLLKQIRADANSRFDSSIHERENEINGYLADKNWIEQLISYFLRDYKQELTELYAEKDELFSKKTECFEKLYEIKERLSEAFDDKDKAYSDLYHYKQRIDSWYAKSDRTPWLFGNAGRKLPNHSLFGQSLGDLNSYKYDRDSAYKNVRSAKARIGDLKQEQHEIHRAIQCVKEEIGKIFSQISSVKGDMGKLVRLKEAGHRREQLQEKLDRVHLTIDLLASEIQNIKKNKREFVDQEAHRYGVVNLETKIERIRTQREEFLHGFDFDGNEEQRKRVHREIWLKQKGEAE